MTRELRIGLIGLGTMGWNHARVLSSMQGVSFVAAADPIEASRREIEHRTRANAYADHVGLLAESDVDAVVIAVPTDLHAEVASAAIARGVHVLIEKPLAATSAEARVIRDAARAAGVRLAVGHVERFNPAIVALKAHLTAGDLGRTYFVRSRRESPLPSRLRDVGVTVDLGTHDIDLMRHLLGEEPALAYGVTARRVHGNHEDLLHGVLSFASGIVGTIDVNWLTPTKIRELTVIGESGMFSVHLLSQSLSFHSYSRSRTVSLAAGGGWPTLAQLVGVAEGDVIRYAVSNREPLVAELEDFVASCGGGDEPAVTGDDGVRALEIAEAFLRSAQECRPVPLSRPADSLPQSAAGSC